MESMAKLEEIESRILLRARNMLRNETEQTLTEVAI